MILAATLLAKCPCLESCRETSISSVAKQTSKIIGLCNPSKLEAKFWGWLEVWRPALLCFTVNQHCSLSLLTVWSLWGDSGVARCWRKSNLHCWIHPAAKTTLGNQCTDVRFASFLSGEFNTMAVINTPVRKLAKRISVQWWDLLVGVIV